MAWDYLFPDWSGEQSQTKKSTVIHKEYFYKRWIYLTHSSSPLNPTNPLTYFGTPPIKKGWVKCPLNNQCLQVEQSFLLDLPSQQLRSVTYHKLQVNGQFSQSVGCKLSGCKISSIYNLAWPAKGFYFVINLFICQPYLLPGGPPRPPPSGIGDCSKTYLYINLKLLDFSYISKTKILKKKKIRFFYPTPPRRGVLKKWKFWKLVGEPKL